MLHQSGFLPEPIAKLQILFINKASVTNKLQNGFKNTAQIVVSYLLFSNFAP